MTRESLMLVESENETLQRRTFQITHAQDLAIQERSRRSGNSWSAIVRQLLTRGIEAEAEDAAAIARARKN